MKRLSGFVATGLLSAALLGVGCVTPNRFHGDPQLLQSIEDGKTTKEAVVLKLGQPSATLESEKFLTYRLGSDPQHGYYILDKAPVGWAGVKYNLVLVFDAQGLLQRHSLVEIH